MRPALFAPQKDFHLAVEQAQEVLDRRAGRAPATAHDPVDVLCPNTWPDHMVDEERPALPPEPAMADLQACGPAQALAWLRRVAAAPDGEMAVRAAAALEGYLRTTCPHPLPCWEIR